MTEELFELVPVAVLVALAPGRVRRFGWQTRLGDADVNTAGAVRRLREGILSTGMAEISLV